MVLKCVDQNPESKKLLLQDLDEFLDRPRDHTLFDLPPPTRPPSKLAPGPTEAHSREQSQSLGSRAAAHPDLADVVTVPPVCQEELYDPGRNVSINPNRDPILML